jgi:secondary thiamine-phosphate synthase enzyme
VTTCEFESGLVQDLKEMFERVFPKKISYAHDATWGDANGFSHVRASMVGSSLTVPFKEGAMVLGTWQQIILIDFDNTPRRRRVVVQFQGE